MKVWGLAESELEFIARQLDMELDNVRREGRAVAFKLNPTSSRARYARRSSYDGFTGKEGRRLKACCYHGFRDFGLLAFAAGATRMQSSFVGGRNDFHNVAEFARAWERLAYANIGTMMCPWEMINACTREDHSGVYDVVHEKDTGNTPLDQRMCTLLDAAEATLDESAKQEV